MIGKELILKLAEEALDGTGIYVVKLDIKPGNNILISLDSDAGVKIEDCIKLSRFIDSKFDREVEDFSLEVSSFGLTQALALPRQYTKNIGREVTVLKIDGVKLNGTLTEADEESFTILPKIKAKGKKKVEDAEKQKIYYIDVKEVKVVITFK